MKYMKLPVASDRSTSIPAPAWAAIVSIGPMNPDLTTKVLLVGTKVMFQGYYEQITQGIYVLRSETFGETLQEAALNIYNSMKSNLDDELSGFYNDPGIPGIGYRGQGETFSLYTPDESYIEGETITIEYIEDLKAFGEAADIDPNLGAPFLKSFSGPIFCPGASIVSTGEGVYDLKIPAYLVTLNFADISDPAQGIIPSFSFIQHA